MVSFRSRLGRLSWRRGAARHGAVWVWALLCFTPLLAAARLWLPDSLLSLLSLLSLRQVRLFCLLGSIGGRCFVALLSAGACDVFVGGVRRCRSCGGAGLRGLAVLPCPLCA
jgi:hypothetical protein